MQAACFEMAGAFSRSFQTQGLSNGSAAAQRSGLLEQAGEPDQEDGADDRHYDAADNAASGIDAERIKDPSANDCADDAQDDIHEGAVAAAFHDLAGSPSRDQSNDDPPDEVRHAILL